MNSANGNAHLNRFAPPVDIPQQGEDDAGLPAMNEGEYKAHANPSNKPCFSIHFVTPDGRVRSCQMSHLDSNTSYEPGIISLKFLGMEPVKVAIKGRNLWKLYDCIHRHVMPWIMQAPRDMGQDGETFISAIGFEAVSEQE